MINKNLNGIVFDLEATCEDRSIASRYDNEVIEIGAVKVVEGVIVDEFSAFVKPVRTPKLTAFCTKLTSITQKDVDNAETFDKVYTEFMNWSDGLPLLSWGFYDAKQLHKDCNHWNLPTSALRTHRSLKHEYGELKGIRPCGMSTALKREGIALEGTHHRGIDDARNIAKIYINSFSK